MWSLVGQQDETKNKPIIQVGINMAIFDYTEDKSASQKITDICTIKGV